MQDPQENQKFSVQEFAAKLKEKYPQYQEVDDFELVQSVVEKYPQYAKAVDLGQPKKKISTDSQSTGAQGNTASVSKSRKQLIEEYKTQAGVDASESDDYLARAMARVHPEYRDVLTPKLPEPSLSPDEPASAVEEPRDAFKIIDENPNEFQRMWNRSIASSEIGKITARSFYGDSIDFEELAYYQQVLQDNAPQESDLLMVDEENVIGSFLMDVIRTVPESFISLIDASLSPEAAAAAGTGAAAGAAFTPVGAATGAVAGAAFAGSGMLTFGTTLLDKLQRAGVDITNAEELEKAWNNKEFIEPLVKEAAIKGGIVGSFDALSAGIGGSISKSTVKAGYKRATAEGFEYAVQGTLGGAGEAVGSVAAGDEINWRDVALEAVADPAAEVMGRGKSFVSKQVKTALKGKTNESEQFLLDKMEEDPDGTSKKVTVSTVENAEQLGNNKSLISELEGALKNAPKDQKKAIREEINKLRKANTDIHANAVKEYSEYSNQEIEEMSTLANEMVGLVKSMKSPEMTETQKEALSKVVESKNEQLKEKKNKAQKRRGKRINVSATNRKTGAPETIEEAPVQEAPVEEFIEPDAAQGFEEFEGSEEAAITSEDIAKEVDDFEQLQKEMPDISPEEAPKLVQKRLDKKGREVKAYSVESEEDGVKTTEYYSEREGQPVSEGGVVFTKEEGFDRLLAKFNIPEETLSENIGEDAEAVILKESKTDGENGAVTLKVKKPEGLFDIEIPFIDAKPIESAEAEVDNSLTEEGKEQAQMVAAALRETVAAVESADPNDLTEEQIQALEAAAGIETPSVPMEAYQDVFEADESLMDAEDVELMQGYFSGEAKESKLDLGYIKDFTNAVENSTKESDEKVEKIKSKVNSSLTSHLKDALADGKSFTQFIAENAKQGDFFTVGKALYRIGEVIEEKTKAVSAVDLEAFNLLKNSTGKTNVKDALDVLYKKVMDKTITEKEEALLSDFENGRYKGVKDKRASINDITTLLRVLEVTGKDGKEAIKQAYAMARDKKVGQEMSRLTDKYTLLDENGKPVLTEDGYKQFDFNKAPAAEGARFRGLMRQAGKNKLMRQFFNAVKDGKFKEIVDKKNPISITQYMAERGIKTSAGKGLTREVKFQRYSRKTGEPIPTATAGKRKEVIRKRKTEFREYKEEQYTAKIKDGKLIRKATNSSRITDAYGKMGNASYTRFRDEVTAGKAEKLSGSEFIRSKQTRAKVSAKFEDGTREVRDPRTGKTAKVEKFKMIDAVAYRPKNKSNLVGHIEKVFGLHRDSAEAAAEISERLIKNMARRAGVKVSEIYDRITLVKNEFKGSPESREDIRSPRALKSILRKFGTPISQSNLDENGNPIDFTTLDQSAKPITADVNKHKQKGAEGVYSAKMIEDLKEMGLNVDNMKGDIRAIIEDELMAKDSRSGARKMRLLFAQALKGKRLDGDRWQEMPYLEKLVKNEIAASMKIKVESLTDEDIVQWEKSGGRTLKEAVEEYARRAENEQLGTASSWLNWLEEQADYMSMDDISLEQFGKAFNIVKMALSYNYTLVNNPDNKLQKRNWKTADNHHPFVEEVADDLLFQEGDNPIVDYTKLLSEKTKETASKRIVKKNDDGTFWVKYSHLEGMTFDQKQEEIIALTCAAQESTWCTRTDAANQLAGGNFHILFDKNFVPKTAIRIENGRIAEERGNTADQSLIEKYDKHLSEYKSEGNVQGFEEQVELRNLEAKMAELDASDEIQFEGEPRGLESVKDIDTHLSIIAEAKNPVEALTKFRKKLSKYGYSTWADQITLISPDNVKTVTSKSGIKQLDVVRDKDVYDYVVVSSNVMHGAQIAPEFTRLNIKNLIISGASLRVSGQEITIGNITETPSSMKYSNDGFVPEIIVEPEKNGFKNSKEYGDIQYVYINEGVAAVTFPAGIGAVQVTEGRNAWITDISFSDNVFTKDISYRAFANIQDRRRQNRVTTYEPQDFDKNGYFAKTAYDETWGEGARILNQEHDAQLNKEEFLNTHLRGMQGENLNRFKTKKEAAEFIKKHKKNNPALKFNPIKKTMGVDAGMWFIDIQRNPKHRLERKTNNDVVRASIALVDGQAVIFAMTNPNVSSVVHEMSHMYEEYLTPAEVKKIEKWSGAKRGSVEFSETFARGFERFLADGKAPTPELKSIFSQFKEWMKNIYRAIIGSPIEKDITPEVREIFENMVMVEGDVNFRETDFNSDIVGSVKGKVKKLNQQDKVGGAKGGRKSRIAVENSNKKIAGANELGKESTRRSLAKNWSERQAGIRSYFEKRGMTLAEQAMNNRAGVSARAAHAIKPIVERIYESFSVEQENTFNEMLLAKRVIQIEKNREEKRNYAAKYLNDFINKRQIILDTIENGGLNEKQLKVAEQSLETINKSIEKVQKIYDKNRLYKVDKNGIETGELAFKHPQGMTIEDAQSTLTELRKRSDYIVLENRSKLYFDAMRQNLKDLYDGGVINKETYDRFKKDDYIPRAFLSHIFGFQHDADGEAIKVNFAENADFYKSIGLGEDQIKQLAEGSEGDLIVNSRYLLEKAFKASSARVLKNRAARALVKEMEGKSANWYKDGLYRESNGKIVEDAYGNYEVLKPKEGIGFKNVYYLEDGKKRAFQLDIDSYNQWNDLELKFSDNKGIETVRKWSGVGLLKAAATGANPLFFLANVPMDMAHVLFFTDVYDDNKLLPINMIKISRKFGRNAKNLVKLDAGVNDSGTARTKELLDTYMEYGGGMDFLTQQGQSLFESSVDESNSKRTKRMRAKIGKALGYTGNTTELAMRLSTVEQVMSKLEKDRKEGKNSYTDEDIKTIAVGKARATMDFAQGGLAVKQLDRWIPYLNAAAQAMRVSRKYLSTKEGRANFVNKWAQASVGVAMITFYNLMMNDDDEDNWLDDVPSYIKDNYFVFRNPFSERDEEGKVGYIRIRKTPQVAPFLNLSESIATAMYYSIYPEKDNRAEKTLKERFTRAVRSVEGTLTYVPTGSGTLSKMPPVGQGLMKYVANYDPFRQMNIVPENEINKILPQTEGMRDDRVPTFYKVFAEATGFSPKRSQAAVESVITSPSTNAVVALTYGLADAATNAIFSVDDWKKSKYSGGLGGAMSGSWNSAMERVYRKTNPNWRDFSYERSEELKQIEGSISYEMNAVTDYYAKKKDLEGFKEFLGTVEVEADQKRLVKRYKELSTRDYSKVKGVRKALEIKYARDPEAAAKIFVLYYGVGNLSTKEGVAETKEQLSYMKKNFDFSPSSRFINELKRQSREKYDY